MNTATVLLFKRTNTNIRPSVPSGELTYSFLLGAITGLLEGWEQSLPTSGGAYRWMASANVASITGSVSIPMNAWRAVSALSEDGNCRYTAKIYKQSVNDPGSPPATLSSYDFITGHLIPPTGWVALQPNTTTTNTWAAEYTFVGFDTETVIGTGYWGQTYIDAVAGIDGQNIHIVTVYKQSETDPIRPTGGSYKFDGDICVVPLGWSRTMPTVNDIPTYMATYRFSSNDPMEVIAADTWSYPVIIARTGQDYVNRFKSICFTYSIAPGFPVGGSYDEPTPIGWSDGIPAYEAGKDLWMTSRVFYANGLNPDAWTTPVKVTTSSSSNKMQFSIDGISWHDIPAVDDVYMRTGTNDGSGWIYAGSVRIKGETGSVGFKGSDSITLYTWIAYADDLTGIPGFTTGSPSPSNKCIGVAANKGSSIESNTPSDYRWSLWVGADGSPGSPGNTMFTWYAYANSADGVTDFTTGAWTDQAYLGLAFNKLTIVESQDPSDYAWSKMSTAKSYYTATIFFKSDQNMVGDPPLAPTGGTYNFTTNTLTPPVGWTEEQPTTTEVPTWGCFYTFVGEPEGLLSTADTWNNVYIDAVVGVIPGADGDSVDIIFLRSATPPTSPPVSKAYPALPTGGWVSTVELANAVSKSIPLYSSIGVRTGGVGNYIWGEISRIDGSKVAEVTVYTRGVPTTTPTGGTYTFDSTSPLTTAPTSTGATWTAYIPTGTAHVYTSRAVVYTSADNILPVPITGWSVPTLSHANGTSIRVVELYSQTLSTAPTSVSQTYDFITNVLTNIPNGWSQTRPATSTSITYMTTCTFTVTAPDTSQTKIGTWTTPVSIAKDGVDGQSSYTFIRYSANANGNPMGTSVSTYIGIKTSNVNSVGVYGDYTWSKIIGTDGTSITGPAAYMHIKYSNDGGTTFTSNAGETSGSYIGIYTDNTLADSSSVSSYTWTPVTGAPGSNGAASMVVYKDDTTSRTPTASAGVPTGWSLTIPSPLTNALFECTGNRAAGAANFTWGASKISTSNWMRPGSTVIDGAKIYTGDAYVDTLQIKGNAVTIPITTIIPTTTLTAPATSVAVALGSIDLTNKPNMRLNAIGTIKVDSTTTRGGGEFYTPYIRVNSSNTLDGAWIFDYSLAIQNTPIKAGWSELTSFNQTSLLTGSYIYYFWLDFTIYSDSLGTFTFIGGVTLLGVMK